MDTKSLAKSKRAHTQHHKKHHHNQKAKATTTSTGASITLKPPGNVVKEQPRQSHFSPSLPSNWDRYEDEDDPMTKSQIHGQSSQQSDIVLPKSKGADYAYLISEAKSQNSTRFSSEIFPSFDDFVSDFDQGKDSFLGVRGESLLSTIQNDSFFVDDKTPANYEASFLSLNLHALSKQLAKIDLPKRLFMEPDLFPQDMYSEREQELEPEPEPSKPTTSHNGVNPMVDPTPNPSEIQSKFEPKTAELELDMLLDSFVHANLKEKKEKSRKEESVAFDIDDLLKETSTPVEIGILSETSGIVSNPKSELLDDFDSWLDTI
ncbi:unnamed protein product [Lactuca saligna]|uniref:Uncharacterized protein n=1 Tax=Lactuca saligna TaxID=75948 RepID=A0AA35YA48_LACSI|nr:unnamed protein product [Lactuca saligna]